MNDGFHETDLANLAVAEVGEVESQAAAVEREKDFVVLAGFQDEGFDVEPSGQGELDIGDFHFGAGESAFQGPSGHRGEMAGGVDHKSAEQKKKDGGKEDTPAQPPAETAGWRRGLIGW